MKKPNKRSVMKYFEPVDMGNVLSREMSDLDLDGSFGYFAFQKKDNVLFLNRLKPEDIMNLLRKVGLVDHLNKMGFEDIQVDIDRDEAQINYLKIYYEDKTPENLLVDLRVSESRFVPEKRFFEEDNDIITLDMVVIEWLSAQKPEKKFDPDKPQLPGQNKPGLGSLKYMMDIMYLVGKEVVKDGFMDVPDHFHGAVMYSKKFKFFNPSHEAVLKAMMRDLKGYSLADLSWGMLTKTIIDESTGEPQVYDPSEQIFPVSRRMKEYFKSKKYQEKFKKVYKTKKYKFNYDSMLERRKKMLNEKKTEEL